VTKADGSKLQLVQCRNPWHKEIYSGPYNDEDTVWDDEPDLAVQVKALGAEFERTKKDGLFFMDIDSFTGGYETIELIYFNKDWEVNYLHYKNVATDTEVEYYIENPTNQDFFISADAYSERMVPSSCRDGYSGIVIYVWNPDGSFNTGWNTPFWSGFGKVHIKGGVQGKYRIKTKIYWAHDYNHDYTLKTFGA
jgi:hypothetical protein